MVTANSPEPTARADLAASAAGATGAPVDGHIALTALEYGSLRSEILKLIELQAQLISLIVIALGTMLGIAFQTKNPALALTFPLLALILGISWLNHAHAISRCAAYLARELEPRFEHSALGWENYVRRNPLHYAMLGYWGVRSIFMGSSVTAMTAGVILLRGKPVDIVEIVLVAFSCIVTLATILIFAIWREPSPHRLLAEARERNRPGCPQ